MPKVFIACIVEYRVIEIDVFGRVHLADLSCFGDLVGRIRAGADREVFYRFGFFVDLKHINIRQPQKVAKLSQLNAVGIRVLWIFQIAVAEQNVSDLNGVEYVLFILVIGRFAHIVVRA